MSKEESQEKHEDVLTDNEIDVIERHASIRAVAIFEVIRREGELELDRPPSALALSGLIAGLALGLSVLSEALFRQYLPDAGWRPLVENLGYSVGFLIVILGRMQLFTENTITAVCPVLDARKLRFLMRLLRLWAIVLAANLVGASLFGLILHATRGYQPETWQAVVELSNHALGFGWMETMLRGIGAGWLIAVLVWTMPNAEKAKFYVIILITYLIALADFSHVVAGTVEAAVAVLAGDVSAVDAVTGFVVPSLIGNLLGGTVFFTLLAWAQIRTELLDERDLLTAWRDRA